MANYEATRYDFDGANLTDIQGVNTGIIIPWTSTSVPSGFLECTGAAVSRSTYSALFAVVGTTYGAGDGSSTFTLPNLADAVVVSKSPAKSLASTGGANTVACTGNLSGSLGNTTLSEANLPEHLHGQGFGPQAAAFQNNSGMGQSAARSPETTFTSPPVGGGGAHSHPLSGSVSGTATSVLQPYLALIYVIKT
jgi:microcystin-dependent protein